MSEKYINASSLIKRFEKWHDDLNRQIEGSVDFPSTRYGYKICRTQLEDCMNEVLRFPGTDVRPVPPGGIGEMSDGYHTFNSLYYQRMVLFAALVKQNKDSAWKSHRHEDGELCFGGGWFIVGIDTPDGSYTYHYEDKDWDLFDCEELPVGKHWDGHTEDDVTRLLSLPEMRPVVRGHWIGKDEAEKIFEENYSDYPEGNCSVCGHCDWDCVESEGFNYCPNCGAEMTGGSGNE